MKIKTILHFPALILCFFVQTLTASEDPDLHATTIAQRVKSRHSHKLISTYLSPRLARASAIERPLAPAIPDIARGYEEIYLRFVRGKVIYKPNPDSDEGRVDLPFAALPNPLEGTFDLKDCGDTGLLIINSGCKEKRAENIGKAEVWITPKFVVEHGLVTSSRHLAPIMRYFTSPIGVFWSTYGEYAYLTVQNFDSLSDGKNLHELLHSPRVRGHKVGDLAVHGFMHRSPGGEWHHRGSYYYLQF